MSVIRYMTRAAVVVAMAVCAMNASRVLAAEGKEAQLLRVLETGGNPEKAIACKRLAIYGTKNAVPALAALLPDKELSSWARIALEAITDPAADEALRTAAGKLEGRLLIGVINSIGYRRDAKAVDVLTPKLKDADAEVASAAAAALGKIGGEPAATALVPMLAQAPADVRTAVAEGCILCAERFMADGNRERAAALYDTVRKADVVQRRVLEATRGAILARGEAGIPLLVEQLRSANKRAFAMALSTARELAIPQVTDTLVAELSQASPQRQALLIIALADRGDTKALPAVIEAVKSGPANVRVVAATALEKLGNASCVSTLLQAAAEGDAQLSQAAKTTLAKLGGKEIDADLLARFAQSSGKAKCVLIALAEQRRIDGALPMVMKCAEDSDPLVRTAAIESIGAVGDQTQAAELVKLLGKTQAAKDRADIEKALMSICGRWGKVCASNLLPLMQSDDAAIRTIGLRTLVCAGGSDALAAVKSAIGDKDETVKDEAVRTLSSWPNRWRDDAAVAEPLLALAKSGGKLQHKVLALRGYLQYVQNAKSLSPANKLAKVNEAIPLITRPEEKRLAIATLSHIETAGSLDPLMTFAADGTVAEEACNALVTLAGKNIQGLSKDARVKALQTAAEKAQSDGTKRRAEAALKKAQ